jgi:hypothetical protein
MVGKAGHRNEKPITPAPTPSPGDNHPFFFESRYAAENGSLSRNVCSTGSGPKPQFPASLLSFGGGTTIRDKGICQLLLALYSSRGGSPETRTADTLIKSQGHSGPGPNIDKKAQPFSKPASFFFDNGRCMFCPGSGTKQAQPRTQGLRIGPRLAGGLCRY